MMHLTRMAPGSIRNWSISTNEKELHDLEHYQPRSMSGGTHFQSQVFLQLSRLARRFGFPGSWERGANREVRNRSPSVSPNRVAGFPRPIRKKLAASRRKVTSPASARRVFP
jgi:hypothetical protein